MARLFLYILTLGFLFPQPVWAAMFEYKCPENLQSGQSVSRLPHGWISSTLTDNVPEADHITMFDGPPGEMASLVPTNEPAAPGEAHFWTFPAQKDNPLWMRCGYAGRTLYLMRPLPNEVIKCTQSAVHTLSCE